MIKCRVCQEAKNEGYFNYNALMCDKCWRKYLTNASVEKMKLVDDTLHMLEKQVGCLHAELDYHPIGEEDIWQCKKCLKEFKIQEYNLNPHMPYQLDIILNDKDLNS